MRKIAAIPVADIVGYSRPAGTDEDRKLSRLRGLRGDLIDPAIEAHYGRIVKRTGDGSLIEFRSVVDAVRCTILDAVRPAERDKLATRIRKFFRVRRSAPANCQRADRSRPLELVAQEPRRGTRTVPRSTPPLAGPC
jgi:class 3 adenylate cyclase